MISLRNVTKLDRLGSPVLNNVSLEVREGDFLLISGGNTDEREQLLYVLGALDTVSSGEVYVDGIELTKYTASQLVTLRREKFGYFLKEEEVDPALTVKENVELPLLFSGTSEKLMEEKVQRVLQIVGMADFKDVRVSSLSVWQKNKLGLAMVLVKDPKVMVLIEPMRVFEKARMAEVTGLLSALNKDGVTIIVTSSLDDYQSVAKRRIEITNGSIVELRKERAKRAEGEKPKARKPRTTTKKVKVTEKIEEVTRKPKSTKKQKEKEVADETVSNE